MKSNVDSHFGQTLAEPLAIGIQSRAAGHFIANRNDFCD
jgi:hypothetical protein